VSAIAPRIDDESGPGDAALVTLAFDGGPAARVDVSFIEPGLRQEIVIACDGRSVVLDAFDARAPLQIQASARHRGPQRDAAQWAETVSEHPVAETGSRIARAAETFVAAVRKGDAAATNARDVATAAQVWETARASIERGGEMLALTPSSPLARAVRPALQLIEGGGHRVVIEPRADGRRPARHHAKLDGSAGHAPCPGCQSGVATMPTPRRNRLLLLRASFFSNGWFSSPSCQSSWRSTVTSPGALMPILTRSRSTPSTRTRMFPEMTIPWSTLRVRMSIACVSFATASRRRIGQAARGRAARLATDVSADRERG
jgi:hypothetical protein